jgi:hypothetical protein
MRSIVDADSAFRHFALTLMRAPPVTVYSMTLEPMYYRAICG